ncbi:MAG: ParA family protein [Oscillospiraceae bacterium]|jgi:chromosome partitioning protein|nr:ParA family protein [Oscillospiraceae bacterium]
MAKAVAVVNQKGGVGKSTTCINLCYALKSLGKRVLLCDCDPQGNSTSGMGLEKGAGPGTYDVLMNGVMANAAIVSTKYGDVLPANRDLSGALIELVSAISREFILKDALEPIFNDYDYIFLDCPPSLELLTLNALCAAESLIIPVQCEYFALEGLTDLIGTLKAVNAHLNPGLYIEGILLTMYDSRTNLSSEVAEDLRNYFPGKVFETHIPRNVRVSEAPSYGKPVIAYDRSSKGSRAYLKLANEFLSKQRELIYK